MSQAKQISEEWSELKGKEKEGVYTALESGFLTPANGIDPVELQSIHETHDSSNSTGHGASSGIDVSQNRADITPIRQSS